MNDEPKLDPAQILDIACVWLGLKPLERTVLRLALWARGRVENGHFLCTPHAAKSAERMIARGFLTRTARQITPPNRKAFGPVVVLEEDNWRKLVSEANATRMTSPEPDAD